MHFKAQGSIDLARRAFAHGIKLEPTHTALHHAWGSMEAQGRGWGGVQCTCVGKHGSARTQLDAWRWGFRVGVGGLSLHAKESSVAQAGHPQLRLGFGGGGWMLENGFEM
eukprot:scaffold24265_cov45-Isochrysis_galbana.AAC.1